MRTITPEAAKVELKKRGHSCRSAAKEIGRSYQWINQVLNGHVTSRPVLRAIFELPLRKSALTRFYCAEKTALDQIRERIKHEAASGGQAGNFNAASPNRKSNSGK